MPRVLGGDDDAFGRSWQTKLEGHSRLFDMVMRLNVIAGLRDFEPYFLLRA